MGRAAVGHRGVGRPVARIDFVSYDEGNVSHAEFGLAAPLYSRYTYIFDASGSANVPSGADIEVARLSEDWFLQSEDVN